MLPPSHWLYMRYTSLVARLCCAASQHKESQLYAGMKAESVLDSDPSRFLQPKDPGTLAHCMPAKRLSVGRISVITVMLPVVEWINSSHNTRCYIVDLPCC